MSIVDLKKQEKEKEKPTNHSGSDIVDLKNLKKEEKTAEFTLKRDAKMTLKKSATDQHGDQRPISSAAKQQIDPQKRQDEETYLTGEDIMEGINSQNINSVGPQRRQLLKFLLVGSGAFMLGLIVKSFGLPGLFSKSKSGSEIMSGLEPENESRSQQLSPKTEVEFNDWRVIENKGELVFIDKKTNENILILDL